MHDRNIWRCDGRIFVNAVVRVEEQRDMCQRSVHVTNQRAMRRAL